MTYIFSIIAICFFAFLMSQIEEQSIEEVGNFNAINKDRCNPQPSITPYPVNLQEVDIFPGPHSYINSQSNLSPKIIHGKKAAKASCGEESQNGEAIVQTPQHQINVDDKTQDKDTTGR